MVTVAVEVAATSLEVTTVLVAVAAAGPEVPVAATAVQDGWRWWRPQPAAPGRRPQQGIRDPCRCLTSRQPVMTLVDLEHALLEHAFQEHRFAFLEQRTLRSRNTAPDVLRSRNTKSV